MNYNNEILEYMFKSLNETKDRFIKVSHLYSNWSKERDDKGNYLVDYYSIANTSIVAINNIIKITPLDATKKSPYPVGSIQLNVNDMDYEYVVLLDHIPKDIADRIIATQVKHRLLEATK